MAMHWVRWIGFQWIPTRESNGPPSIFRAGTGARPYDSNESSFNDPDLPSHLIPLPVRDDVKVNPAGDFVACVVGQIPRDRRAIRMQFFDQMRRDREDLDRRAHRQPGKR